jgi:hypothetical protein
MKRIYILLALSFFCSHCWADILTCPRDEEIHSELELKQKTWCNSNRFAEGANELFELEVNAYRDKNLTPLLQDNVHDAKWLVSKATQDFREHTFCLEYICRALQTSCADNMNYSMEKTQSQWCENRAEEFGKIEKEKMILVLHDNQERKSRSNLREKMRALEGRLSKIFIPSLQRFFGEYRRFTEKVPTFIRNPVS